MDRWNCQESDTGTEKTGFLDIGLSELQVWD